MKKATVVNAMLLALMILLGLIAPVTATAQKSDGFFRGGNDNYQNRGDVNIPGNDENGISNYGIGETVPLGSGLLIVTAIGAGYAISRRKRNLKHGTTMLLVFAMLLSITSCKKNVETISTVATDGVFITLDLDGGSKVIVDPTGHTNPNYATVTFEEHDIIYVGNNGKYCGYLEHNGTNFSGTVNPTSEADYLHFYFMGNKGGKSEPSSVSINDQTSKYPVISYAHSTELYNSGISNYSARLFNKCAIMKFTTTAINKAITITGMNNTVTVNFAANNGATTGDPFSFSKSGNGEIKLHAESNTVRWAILLPQNEVTTATAYAVGYTTTSAFTVPNVSANGYYSSGVTVDLTVGSPKGAFTINDSGDQVFFSSGNLQYQASTSTWRFAENQWSFVGDATNGNVYVSGVKSNNASIASNYSGWIDLFCWGTSGYNHGAIEYQPYSTSNNYDKHYAYGSSTYNLYDQTGQADWGYAASAASLDGQNTWRTLTKDEWVYVFNTRTVNGGTGSGKSYTLGKSVNGVSGIVLYPDNYTGSEYSGSNWSTFESKGCVFLPKTGRRSTTTIYDINTYGYYWSSSYSNTYYAYCLRFNNSVDPQNSSYRQRGYSIRLVRPVE